MTDLAPPLNAPQHEPGPRPLPLFLEMVRRTAARDPHLAARALAGLRVYQRLPRSAAVRLRPAAHRHGAASLRDCGGSGRSIVLVPSLINPPHILDLDSSCSMAEALTASGRVLLLDWGPAAERPLSITGHVRELLEPLLGKLGERPVLVGYCLGGTMALASEAPVRAVATLAAPWTFGAYPAGARDALLRMWTEARPLAERLRALPIEVLQSAFWSVDPERVVAKYAGLADRDSADPTIGRFVALEDWANSGEPLPLAAAAELIDELFTADRAPWAVPGVPTLHFTATGDRIVPAETAAPGERRAVPAGHVGMIVGRSAPEHLHAPLRQWIDRL